MTDWPFSFSPIPYKPEGEQDWRRSILEELEKRNDAAA